MILNNKQNSYLNINNNDINYNQLNIIHHNKSPIKKNHNNISSSCIG